MTKLISVHYPVKCHMLWQVTYTGAEIVLINLMLSLASRKAHFSTVLGLRVITVTHENYSLIIIIQFLDQYQYYCCTLLYLPTKLQ